MKQLFAGIAYIIVLIVMCIMACPIIYGIFQIVVALFGMLGDEITGTNDNWSSAFGA